MAQHLVEWRDARGFAWSALLDDSNESDDIAIAAETVSPRTQGRSRVATKRGAVWTQPAPHGQPPRRPRFDLAKRVREPEACLCGINCARLRLEERVPTQETSRREMLRQAFADTAYMVPCQAPGGR